LAQILGYYTQPNAVAQDHTDVDSHGAVQGSFSISFAGMGPYDWANMPNSISDSSPLAQQKAIGQLMYHAAVSVDSDFEASDTSANPSLEVSTALQTYFSYTCGSYENKAPSYTSSQWYNKIASDIDAKRPVFYTMFQADGSAGHAVVCDGYENGNEIHLNLGWSGSWDAWYNIDSVAAGGYTWTIDGGVFGITPPTPTITSVSPNTLSPSPTAQTLTISGSNFNFTGPNASAVVFYDPNDDATTVTPANPTATSMQCSIALQTSGTWEVKVVNGGIESPLYNFTVASISAQLIGLSISGPANVIQNTSANQYTATAVFSDGSTTTVTPTWSLNAGAPASISSSGQLTTYSVTANTAITITASYTYSGVTKTANYGAIIVPSGSCGSSQQQLITNGSFANGSTGWTLVGNFQADSRFSNCHTCPGYAYLANSDGSPGNNLSGTLSQTITIPANATSVTIGYWYLITSSDSTTTPYDYLYLNLVLPGGTLVGIDQLSNVNAGSSYVYRSFDITAYRGQTVTVRFIGTTDASGPTVFRVDDVSVMATVPNPVVPVLFGVGGPTSVPQGSTGQYNAIVVNCDNSIQSVSPSWSITSGPATISTSGLLTAGSVSADTPATVTAIYNGSTRLDYPITIVHVAPVFASLAINGPDSVNANGSGQFTASAVFSDGTSETVSPSWSVISGPGSISTSGLLMVGQVSGNTTTTISASYTIGNLMHSATQQVSIIYVAPPPTLTSLSINGPDSVNENSTAQYSATAWFSDGSSQVINPVWNMNSGAATISIFGLLSAGEVEGNTLVTISASFATGGVNINTQKVVTVLNVGTAPVSPLSNLSASNGVFSCSFYGQIGSNYEFQASTDLAHWIMLYDFTCTNSPMTLVDPMAGNYRCRFYRVGPAGAAQALSLGIGLPNAWTPNGLQLALCGPLGSNYLIQASIDLVNWQTLTNFTTLTMSPLYLCDPAATNYNHRFYRATIP
jgi:hypothetical protein